MLTSLSIRNVVLIKELDLQLEKGLCIFTGETGAGKSVLLDSVALVLGEKTNTKLIRHGADALSVTACFELPLSHSAFSLMSEQGLLVEDNQIIIRRTVSKEGKSKAFINNQPVPLSFLKQLGNELVEIHGQFSAHYLLDPQTHMTVLDKYGKLEQELTECRRAFHQWEYKENQYTIAVQNQKIAQENEDFIRSAVAELKMLKPQKDEEEKLTKKRTVLMNAEKTAGLLNEAYQRLSDEENGCLAQLNRIYREVEKANRLTDGQFENLIKTLDGAESALTDVNALLEAEAENLNTENNLEAIDNRLFALKDCARKHHVSIDRLPDLLADFEAQLNALDKADKNQITLQKECEKARLEYLESAEKLSKARREAAQKLDAAVAEELPCLKLEKAKFETHIESLPEEKFNETGKEKITFLVSTNAGTPFQPIHKIASGGELARFMLALKVNLAKTQQIPVLIFDEVDTGISGAVADAVGQRLEQLAESCQVLVITHSPQVASYGVHHYNVQKTSKDNITITDVYSLDYDARLKEIARMLSGAKITQAALSAAAELLEKSCKKLSTS